MSELALLISEMETVFSKKSGYIHLEERVPIYENALYAYALCRTRHRVAVLKGVELFSSLLRFQEKGFPPYMDQFRLRLLPDGIHLRLLILFWLFIRDFSVYFSSPETLRTSYDHLIEYLEEGASWNRVQQAIWRFIRYEEVMAIPAALQTREEHEDFFLWLLLLQKKGIVLTEAFFRPIQHSYTEEMGVCLLPRREVSFFEGVPLLQLDEWFVRDSRKLSSFFQGKEALFERAFVDSLPIPLLTSERILFLQKEVSDSLGWGYFHFLDPSTFGHLACWDYSMTREEEGFSLELSPEKEALYLYLSRSMVDSFSKKGERSLLFFEKEPLSILLKGGSRYEFSFETRQKGNWIGEISIGPRPQDQNSGLFDYRIAIRSLQIESNRFIRCVFKKCDP